LLAIPVTVGKKLHAGIVERACDAGERWKEQLLVVHAVAHAAPPNFRATLPSYQVVARRTRSVRGGVRVTGRGRGDERCVAPSPPGHPRCGRPDLADITRLLEARPDLRARLPQAILARLV
jgi:hypothetical protein